ncbi:MAG: GTPase HflX [bacterium]|nr:GTPase HflX [bacterium]MBU1916799.1 GTPase HflX [bacterium]
MNKTTEQAYVIGIYHHRKTHKYDALESFDEAKNLTQTAGAVLMGDIFVEIRQFNTATFLGKGKVEELKERFAIIKPDLIIIDTDLTPVQNRNLEKTWQIRVVDRTGLILDIFAQRARSKEGKLQVELAQYQYLLPRLIGAWTHLKKSQGGIGFRGPGETQLEVDRRRARERIVMLKKNLERVTRAREIHRNKRQAVPIPTVSLIGYTNAGKSTLFNSLLKAHELAEDKLFATLDPKTKRLRLPSGQIILISDTVGFIRNLPHQLIESFKSTFEEVADSDVLVHVIDASHPDRTQQIQTVEQILKELGLSNKPIIKVMNKIDLIDKEQEKSHFDESKELLSRISSLKEIGLDDFQTKIETTLNKHYYNVMNLLIPHDKGKILNDIYTHGSVMESENIEEGTLVTVNLPQKWKNKYAEYSTLTRT